MAVAQISRAEPWRRRLYLPAYSVADAARYAGTHSQTVAYWHYGDREHVPTLPGKERAAPLSYLQLVEVAFVATFRRLGVSLQRIRKARDYLAQVFVTEYPFAEGRFLTEGRHVLLMLQSVEPDAELDHMVVADRAGQLAWQPLIGARFAEFEYELGLALKWHVGGGESAVLIDPRVSFGAPAVRGVPTWAIRGRWAAGETLDDIQSDFALDTHEVEQALRFEGVLDAA